MQFQKISILSPKKALEFLGGRGEGGRGLSTKNKLKKYIKLIIIIGMSRRVGSYKRVSSVGEVHVRIFSGTIQSNNAKPHCHNKIILFY